MKNRTVTALCAIGLMAMATVAIASITEESTSGQDKPRAGCNTIGCPLANVKVVIEAPAIKHAQQGTTNQEGRFASAALPPGEYVVKLTGPPGALATMSLVLEDTSPGASAAPRRRRILINTQSNQAFDPRGQSSGRFTNAATTSAILTLGITLAQPIAPPAPPR